MTVTVLPIATVSDAVEARDLLAQKRAEMPDGSAVVLPVIYHFSTGTYRTEHVALRLGKYVLLYSKPISGWQTAYGYPTGPCTQTDFWLYHDGDDARVLYFQGTVWKWGNRVFHRMTKRAYHSIVHQFLCIVRDLARERNWYPVPV